MTGYTPGKYRKQKTQTEKHNAGYGGILPYPALCLFPINRFLPKIADWIESNKAEISSATCKMIADSIVKGSKREKTI